MNVILILRNQYVYLMHYVMNVKENILSQDVKTIFPANVLFVENKLNQTD